MITKEQLAAMLDGKEYGNEATNQVSEIAKANNLVIVFGASDDLIEFQGAIYDEIDCYNGGTAYVNQQGLCTEGKCEKIEALWCKEDTYSFTYKTDIPHATFDIVEDGDKYCRGIVFSLNDLPK